MNQDGRIVIQASSNNEFFKLLGNYLTQNFPKGKAFIAIAALAATSTNTSWDGCVFGSVSGSGLSATYIINSGNNTWSVYYVSTTDNAAVVKYNTTAV